MKRVLKYLPRGSSAKLIADLMMSPEAWRAVAEPILRRENELDFLRREAESAAEQVANFEASHRRASGEELKAAMGRLRTEMSPDAVMEVVNTVAEVFNVFSAEILGDRRNSRDVVGARQTCMLILVRDRGQTLTYVGAALSRDHKTVHFGVNRAAVSRDPRVAEARSLLR